MATPSTAGETSSGERRAELIWCVRDQNIINNLKRLPEYPLSTINGWVLVTASKCFGSPVSGSDFRVFPFLTPIIAPDNRIAEALTIDNDVGILCVHLISCAEYEFIRTAGLNLPRMLDERHYPPVFNPKRTSDVCGAGSAKA